jgi:hypothetical protein
VPAAKELDQIQTEKVQNALQEVSVEVQRPRPDKSKITTMLTTAADIVKGATALGGLYMAIAKGVEVARQLF